MRLLSSLPTTLALLLALLLALSADAKPRDAKPQDAILLSQVESLTLRAGRQTTHRRVPPAPQLRCISPAPLCARAEHALEAMRCDNRGAGYGPEDVQWTCAAQLPPELKLGSTDVACEGYDSPDDPYVLRGSCGVEYRVVLTREGEERWPDLAGGGGGGGGAGEAVDWFPYLFWAVFVAVLGYIVYGAFVGPRAGGDEHRRRGLGGNNHYGGGGGGGPGGGDDGWGDDDPPPPYPGTNNDRKSQSNRSGGRGAQQQGWRPDWWSAAAGAAAGYGAGRLGNHNNNNNNSSRTSRGGNNYGSSWGGDNGGEGPSRSNSSSSSRYESTGFGSTSRR